MPTMTLIVQMTVDYSLEYKLPHLNSVSWNMQNGTADSIRD